MIYLQKILFKLDKIHRESIKKIDLSPVQLSILKEIEKELLNDGLTIDELQNSLGIQITEGHLRKELSCIVQIIYANVSQGNPNKLILWLSEMQFHEELPHEIKKIEARLLKENDTNALSQLYFESVERFLSAYIENMDFPFIDYLINQYAKLNPNEHDKINTLKAQKLIAQFSVLNLNPIKGKTEFNEAKELYANKIEVLGKGMSKNTLPLFQFWYLMLRDKFSKHFEENHGENTETTDQLIAIYESNKDSINPKYYYNLILREPDRLYRNSQFELAYNSFEKCFEIIPFKLSDFWYDSFAQCCITLGKLDEAEKTIIKNYGLTQENTEKKAERSFSIMAILALIYTLRDNKKKARYFILLAINNCDKNKYALLDMMIKYIECGMYISFHEWDVAKEKNDNVLKFYRYHKGQSHYKIFFTAHKIYNHIINQWQCQKTLPNKYKSTYQDLQKGEFGFLGALLKHLFEKYKIPIE